MRPCSKLLAALALATALAPVAAARDAGSGPLRKPIDRVLDRAGFEAAFWGVEVRRLKDGKVVYSRNAERHFTPASTTKLLTTSAALDAFGGQRRLATTLETTARLDGQGRLLGDLYLIGGGDPTLGKSDPAKGRVAAFEVLADALRTAGVQRVEGRVVGHEGLFGGDRRGDGWNWDDLTWWYGAEVSALSWNDNCADLTVGPGEREGDLVVANRFPESRYYSLAVSATTAAAGTEPALRVFRAAGNAIEITGALPLGGEPWRGFVALEDPALYSATVFTETLVARGIRVALEPRAGREPLPAGRRPLARHESAPLAEIAAGINKPSHNLHAEMLLRLLATGTSAPGEVEAGLAAAQSFRDRLGVRDDSWRVTDGSGLSRSNLITARGLVDLLVAMDRHPQAEAFRASLPIGGQDGTLKKRMKGTAADGRVTAKTGSLGSVNALAGYVSAKSGARYAFAVFANHHTVPGREATAAIDALMDLLARQ